MQTLRPWSAESSERKWAISIATVCFIILIALPFWPEKKHNSAEKELAAVTITNKQVMPVNTPKTTHKPPISHVKKDAKKPIIPVKPRTTAIQTTQKNIPPISSQAYFIQVGAFQNKSHAQKLQKKLIKNHWPVIIQKKKRFYAVQIGPYKNKAKANSIKRQLSHKEKITGFTTHHVYP